MDAAQQEEELLVSEMAELQAAAATGAAADWPSWYQRALSFLQRHGGAHWWCHHPKVMAGGLPHPGRAHAQLMAATPPP